jgi:hypothetical protein
LGSQAKPANDGRANVGRPRNDATQRSLTSAQDPAAEAAQEAGLVYSTDVEPAFAASRKGKGFIYLEPDGKQVRDRVTLNRIQSLTIPPRGITCVLPVHRRRR